ncbi:MAG TPA: GNAT family N-acetyltransferase [Fimbriimonadaceae bacterium]|nr:GNAT family N-acetyltransferase [Fimbriimonadaceae bacterium]
MASFEILENLDALVRLRDEWRDLVCRDPLATPFQTPEWLLSWANIYRPSRPRILTLREGRDLVGLYPLMQKGSPWASLRPIGLGPSDYLQPILQGPEYSSILWEGLRSQSTSHLLDLHQIRENHPLANEKGIAQANCLVLDLPGSFDDYLKRLGKSLRYDVRRFDKVGVTLDFATEETLPQDLDTFFALHETRWKQRMLPGAFVGSKVKHFHLEWGQKAISRGMLWLAILRQGGQAVGAIYVMRHGQTAYFYQAGFDPSFKAISPGSLLVSQLIRRSIEDGLTSFDFLRGDEPYKRRWQPQREYKNVRILISDSSLGRLGERWNTFAHQIEMRVRRQLEG